MICPRCDGWGQVAVRAWPTASGMAAKMIVWEPCDCHAGRVACCDGLREQPEAPATLEKKP